MKVEYADSFFKSLKRLRRHGTWWYKIYSVFRYDIPNFIKNIWNFRRELLHFRWWDSLFTLEMLQRSLILQEKNIRKYGNEVAVSRIPNCDKIKRIIELIERTKECYYIEEAEKIIGYELMNSEDEKVIESIILKSNELEEADWNEMWVTLNSDLRKWWD